jgi:hypothetical protein
VLRLAPGPHCHLSGKGRTEIVPCRLVFCALLRYLLSSLQVVGGGRGGTHRGF